MWNQVIKVSSGTCQQSVDVLSKSGTFLDFWLWQDSVATYCRWGGNLCDVYIENFLTNHLVKEFRKAVHINLPKLLPNIKGFTFVEHGDVPPVAVISSRDTAAPSSAVGPLLSPVQWSRTRCLLTSGHAHRCNFEWPWTTLNDLDWLAKFLIHKQALIDVAAYAHIY